MLHLVIGLLFYHNMTLPGFSNEKWQVVRNDSVRIYYSDGYENMANKLLIKSTETLSEFSQVLGITYEGEVFVFLVSNEETWNELTRGTVPEWSGGVAKSQKGITYIRIYRNASQILPIIRHELMHLILGKNFWPNIIPRWFEEGLATLCSNQDISEFSLSLSMANVSKSLIPLAEIDDVLNFKKAKANLAYAQSYVGVKLIIDSIGWEAIRKILANGRQSKQWDEAFYSVLEMDEEAYELYLLEYIETHYRWNFLYQSDYVIWVLIPISVVFIYLIIRLRNFRIYKKWSAEEELTNNNLELDE